MTEQKESILEEAQRLIHGPRNKNYGHPRENFADIAALWSGYLDKEVSDIDVANLMILMKVARVKGTGYHRDSFTDIAGYAGCVERIYEESEESEKQQPRVWESIYSVPPDLVVIDYRENAEYYWDGHQLMCRLIGKEWFPWGTIIKDGFNVYNGPFTEVLEAE